MNTAQSVVYFSPPVIVVRTFWAIGFLHCEVKLWGHRSPRSQVNRFDMSDVGDSDLSWVSQYQYDDI